MKLSTLLVAAMGVFASVEGTASLRRASALAEDHEQAVLDAGAEVAALARPIAECRKATKVYATEVAKAKGDREACTGCAGVGKKLGKCVKSGSGFVCKGVDGKERGAFGFGECAKDGDVCTGCDAPTAGYCLWAEAKGATKEHWKCVTDKNWPASGSSASAARPAPPLPAAAPPSAQ